MSADARLAGVSSPLFLNQFLSLKNPHSVGHLLVVNFVSPMKRTMIERIESNSMMNRVGAALLALPYGLGMLAIGVAYLAEGVFKGLANLFLALASRDANRAKTAGRDLVACGVIGAAISLMGIVSATIGTVGLIVAPNWTHRNVITFWCKEENK